MGCWNTQHSVLTPPVTPCLQCPNTSCDTMFTMSKHPNVTPCLLCPNTPRDTMFTMSKHPLWHHVYNVQTPHVTPCLQCPNTPCDTMFTMSKHLIWHHIYNVQKEIWTGNTEFILKKGFCWWSFYFEMKLTKIIILHFNRL